jgi:hypothetical protein
MGDLFGTAATVTANEWPADQADPGARPVSNPGAKLLYPRIRGQRHWRPIQISYVVRPGGRGHPRARERMQPASVLPC